MHAWLPAADSENFFRSVLAADEFDVLLTADKGMEYQQNLATLPVAILIVLAHSNRMEDLIPAVPAILAALAKLPPRTLRKIAA